MKKLIPLLRIFDLSLRFGGFRIGKAKRRLKEILAVPEQDFEAFTEDRKKEIVMFHLRENPFYRSLAGINKFTSWDELPIMKKQDFQRPLAERLSKGYTQRSVYINKTSGSGGDPMTFAKDKEFHALIWANIMRRFAWFGIDFNYSWQARFYGMTLDFAANKQLRLKDFLSKRYRFSIFDLSDAGLEKIVAKFRSKKFNYINGYTSNIVLLAKYLKKKHLVLKDICPTLSVCVTTSEMLFDEDKILLQQWLGVAIVNEYGASELDVIAFQNPDGDWIVNTETLFVEILDDYGTKVANGTEGRIIITALDNKAHPFIRYDVGDLGILDESSTAKKPLLKKLSGRTNDTAILPSGKRPAGMTFYSITKKLFEDDGNVKEFVIRQTKLDTFEIEYVSESPLSEAEEIRIKNVMSQYLEPGLQFIFYRSSALDRGRSGKLKQFTNLVKSAE